MTLQTTDLTPSIGTQVHLDKAAMLAGEHAQELRALLERRGVLLFRGIDLSDEDEIAFAATLGTVRMDFGKPIMKVTFDPIENPEHYQYFDASLHWHMDGTHDDYPPRATVLTPRVLAPEGTGHTEFCNAYAAWEELPEADKKLLEGLQVAHTQTFALPIGKVPTAEQLARVERLGARVQPAVWHHRNGRTSLALGKSAEWIVGMDRAESDALLARMETWMTRPENVYHHVWQMHDVVVWDNTGTLHRALEYDRACGRRMHRVTLVGEEPLSQAA